MGDQLGTHSTQAAAFLRCRFLWQQWPLCPPQWPLCKTCASVLIPTDGLLQLCQRDQLWIHQRYLSALGLLGSAWFHNSSLSWTEVETLRHTEISFFLDWSSPLDSEKSVCFQSVEIVTRQLRTVWLRNRWNNSYRAIWFSLTILSWKFACKYVKGCQGSLEMGND